MMKSVKPTGSINEFSDPKEMILMHINNTPGIRYRELLVHWKNLVTLGLIDKRKIEQLDTIQLVFQPKNLSF